MKILDFYRKLISNNNTASSRRFIAIWTLPFYWISIVTGIYIGFTKADFRFYLAALIASVSPVFLAFFALTWEHVKNILNTKIFKKSDSPFDNINNNELIDP
jgi:hypothetical protein